MCYIECQPSLANCKPTFAIREWYQLGYQKTPRTGPTCFLQRAVIKIRPIFLERVDEKLALFTLFSISFELHIEIRVDFDLSALHVFHTRVESSTLIALFRKAMWSRIIFRNVEFPLSFYCFYCSLIFNRVLQ